MAHIGETGAEAVVTANPGLHHPDRPGAARPRGRPSKVLHIAELLDEAYQKRSRAPPLTLPSPRRGEGIGLRVPRPRRGRGQGEGEQCPA